MQSQHTPTSLRQLRLFFVRTSRFANCLCMQNYCLICTILPDKAWENSRPSLVDEHMQGRGDFCQKYFHLILSLSLKVKNDCSKSSLDSTLLLHCWVKDWLSKKNQIFWLWEETRLLILNTLIRHCKVIVGANHVKLSMTAWKFHLIQWN